MVQINTENHFSLQGIDSLLEGVGVADEVTHHLGYGPLGRGRGGALFGGVISRQKFVCQ